MATSLSIRVKEAEFGGDLGLSVPILKCYKSFTSRKLLEEEERSLGSDKQVGKRSADLVMAKGAAEGSVVAFPLLKQVDQGAQGDNSGPGWKPHAPALREAYHQHCSSSAQIQNTRLKAEGRNKKNKRRRKNLDLQKIQDHVCNELTQHQLASLTLLEPRSPIPQALKPCSNGREPQTNHKEENFPIKK
ncbi:hypothetical protein AAY473_011998 [Plecturocebus cupreus]